MPAKKKQPTKKEDPQAKLSLKQRKFIKYYLETGNASEAALKAGYAFRESGYENLSKPLVQKAYQLLLDKQGFSDSRINKVLDEGLNAEKIIGYLHQYKQKGKKGKVEKIQPDEIISSEFLNSPDHPTRHKFLETLLKLKDKLNNKEEIEVSGEIKHKHFLEEVIKKSKDIK